MCTILGNKFQFNIQNQHCPGVLMQIVTQYLHPEKYSFLYYFTNGENNEEIINNQFLFPNF